MRLIQVEPAHDIPEGWTPVEAVFIVKCLNEDMDTALCVRQSGGLSTWEALGMVAAAQDSIREAMRGDWREHRED